MKIIVCSLSEAPLQFARQRPSHVISLLSPDAQWPEFPAAQHLRLSLNDIATATPGLVAPGETDATKLVSFVRNWGRQDPLLIHCWAGISRSTAAAYSAMCMLRQEDEMTLAQELRQLSPSATPNRLLIKHVDAILGRGGRMLHAIESIGRGAEAYEGSPFEIAT